MTLTEIYEDLWRSLADALDGPTSAMRLPVVATVSAHGKPQARTMVLRDVDLEAGRLMFFSDARGGKLDDLSSTPEAQLVFFHPVKQLQLRVSGAVSQLPADQVEGIWSALPVELKVLYGAQPAPGFKVDIASSGLSKGLFDETLRELDRQELAEKGAQNFAVFYVKALQIEWLLLTTDGNRAARFELENGDLKAANWRIP